MRINELTEERSGREIEKVATKTKILLKTARDMKDRLK